MVYQDITARQGEKKLLPRGYGVRVTTGERLYELFLRLRRAAERAWASPMYAPALVALSALFLFAGAPLGGCVVLGCLAVFQLLLCADLMAVLLPLLLYSILATGFYGKYEPYIAQWPLYAAALAALILHLCWYPAAPAAAQRLSPSMEAVSAALLLGGLGSISAREYFSPVALYYTLGLGVGMLLCYRLFRSRLTRARSYDVLRRFLEILYYTGVFTGLTVLAAYLTHASSFLRNFAALYLPSRNMYAMLLLMALPAACLPKANGGAHFGGLAFLYLSLLLTGSRSGLLFGTLLLGASLVYIYRRNPDKRRVYRIWALLAAIPASALIFLLARALFASRMTDGLLISAQDSRVTFFIQALRDFMSNPAFGRGVGYMGNSSIFLRDSGCIVWYHNLFAQVLGSMGLVGAAAYGWHYVERLRLLLRKRGSLVAVAALSYAGMFLLSMTNPGEFCPLPNELLVVALFAIVESLPDKTKKNALDRK